MTEPQPDRPSGAIWLDETRHWRPEPVVLTDTVREATVPVWAPQDDPRPDFGSIGATPYGEQPLRDHRRTLLIADDDPVVRLALSAELRDSFRIVALASNAIDAIALAEEHRPDAALIDVEMPGGGARRAVPRIATCSPRTRMVVLSADEAPQIVVELLTAGAMAYLRKDVGGERIAETLARALLAPV